MEADVVARYQVLLRLRVVFLADESVVWLAFTKRGYEDTDVHRFNAQDRGCDACKRLVLENWEDAEICRGRLALDGFREAQDIFLGLQRRVYKLRCFAGWRASAGFDRCDQGIAVCDVVVHEPSRYREHARRKDVERRCILIRFDAGALEGNRGVERRDVAG